jgi:hypothetical protein
MEYFMDIKFRENEYLRFGKILNDTILHFNEMLSDNWKINLPFTSDDEFYKLIYRFEEIPYKQIDFNEFDARGVYFIFGYNEKINMCSLYIGKASTPTASIKKEFQKYSKKIVNNKYSMNDKKGNLHNLESIYFIEWK